MHHKAVRGPKADHQCFYLHHSSTHFGLARGDQHLFGNAKAKWKKPTDSEMRSNRKLMLEHEKTHQELHDN